MKFILCTDSRGTKRAYHFKTIEDYESSEIRSSLGLWGFLGCRIQHFDGEEDVKEALELHSQYL